MFVFLYFAVSSTWDTLVAKGKAPPNVSRYFNFLSAQPLFKTVQELLPRPKTEVKQEKKSDTSVSKLYPCDIYIRGISITS